jgi:hypothetical protein
VGRATTIDKTIDKMKKPELEINRPQNAMLRPYLRGMRQKSIDELPIGAPTLLRAIMEKAKREGLDLSWQKKSHSELAMRMRGMGGRGGNRNGRDRMRRPRRNGGRHKQKRGLLQESGGRSHFSMRGQQPKVGQRAGASTHKAVLGTHHGYYVDE